MPKKLWIVASLTVAAGLIVTLAGTPSSKTETAELMRAKLTASKIILESLALEDFDGLKDSSRKLSRISQQAAWQVRQTPDYLDLSARFRHQVDRLEQAATEKNLDAAAWAYTRITMSCLDCHKYLRDKSAVASVGFNAN